MKPSLKYYSTRDLAEELARRLDVEADLQLGDEDNGSGTGTAATTGTASTVGRESSDARESQGRGRVFTQRQWRGG